MGKVAKLVMVTAENNNKFYNMKEENGMILIERGRIDVTTINEKPVPISQWDSLYKSKVRKGYVDQTHLFAEAVEPAKGSKKDSSPSFADITDPTIGKFINQLQMWANKQVEQNYTISTSAVTQKQIDAAQSILNDLTSLINIGADLEELNRFMLDLFRTLPRRMAHVQDWLIKPLNDKQSLDFAMQLISHEQDLLDTMKGQVKVYAAQQEQHSDEKKKQTLLEAMGLEFFSISDKEKTKIISKIEESDHKKMFRQGFRVVNQKTQKKFDSFVSKAKNKSIDELWHGSRNENWWSIVDSGLVLRPTNAVITGKMFGYGTYFADKFRKSLGYTSHSGSYWARGNSDTAILSLYNVHVGEQYHIKRHEGSHSQLTEAKLKALGDYDSVYAHGGADLRNNEFIVYNENQTTIGYIVQVGGR